MKGKITETEFRATFSELPTSTVDELVKQCKKWVEFEEALHHVWLAADNVADTYSPEYGTEEQFLISSLSSAADDLGAFQLTLK